MINNKTLKKIAANIAYKIHRSPQFETILNFIVEVDKFYLYTFFTSKGLERLSSAFVENKMTQEVKIAFLTEAWDNAILEGIKEEELIQYIDRYRMRIETDSSLNAIYKDGVLSLENGSPYKAYGLLVYQAVFLKMISLDILEELIKKESEKHGTRKDDTKILR